MEEVTRAYFAGVMDSNGCIGIVKHKRKSSKPRYYFQLCVQLTTVEEYVAIGLKMAFGGHISNTSRSGFTGAPLWGWAINDQKALSCLKAILPYLRLKRYQAEIAIEFQEARHPGRHISEEQYALQEAQRILIHSRTRKGKALT